MPKKRPAGLGTLAVKPNLNQTHSFRASPGEFETGEIKINEEGAFLLGGWPPLCVACRLASPPLIWPCPVCARATVPGVTISDKAASFEGVKYDDLIMGKMLGRGASATVKLATHRDTGERYAVKCINMYDKSKRGQLVSELHTLYVSDCAALVQFFGATFHEGEVRERVLCAGSLAVVQWLAVFSTECARVRLRSLWSLWTSAGWTRCWKRADPSQKRSSHASPSKCCGAWRT